MSNWKKKKILTIWLGIQRKHETNFDMFLKQIICLKTEFSRIDLCFTDIFEYSELIQCYYCISGSIICGSKTVRLRQLSYTDFT